LSLLGILPVSSFMLPACVLLVDSRP